MTGYKIPIFKQGSILTHEMLETMKHYMVAVTQGVFKDYSDGIICGLKTSVSDGIITVESGLVKYNGTILIIEGNESVPVSEKNELQFVKLFINDKETGTDFESVNVDLLIDSNADKKHNEIEICRMQVQNGARLRDNYQNFEDMGTTYDTLQLIYADYAGYKEPGIHPQILEQFAKELRENREKGIEDICFLQQIYSMHGRSLNRVQIEYYLSEKLKGKASGYSNEEIYNGLCSILRQSRNAMPEKSRIRQPRKMIIG